MKEHTLNKITFINAKTNNNDIIDRKQSPRFGNSVTNLLNQCQTIESPEQKKSFPQKGLGIENIGRSSSLMVLQVKRKRIDQETNNDNIIDSLNQNDTDQIKI